MRNVLVTVSMLALFALTACGKKEASCENVVDNMLSIMAKEAKTVRAKEELEATERDKANGVKECRESQPSAEALSCAANAKTLDEFVGCKLPMMQ